MLDPKTMKYTFVDTCFGTHHLQFGYDADDTLWTSGGGQVAGWLNMKMFDETGDAAGVAGLDGVRARHQRQRQARRLRRAERSRSIPQKDMRIEAGTYAVMPNPVDGSVWGSASSRRGAVRGSCRLEPAGPQLAEIYHVPLPGFGPRGADIDKNGVVWVSLGSGHLGSFDRRKCKGPLNGPNATGDHCPEGWSFHQYPGPGLRRASARTAPSRATTPGSTSTTRSGSARTCRSPPAT